MSLVTESVLANLWSENDLEHLSEGEWLQSLVWRRSASPKLSKAAGEGDVSQFGDAVRDLLSTRADFGKKQARKQRQQLELLWDFSDDSATNRSDSDLPSLESCLFNDVSPLAAVLFQNVEAAPTATTLSTALWILNLHGTRLEPDLCASLYRWAMQNSQRSMQAEGELDAEDGFDNLPALEYRLLAAITFQDIKSGNKLLKSQVKLLRSSLKNALDGDGTPHARYLPQLHQILLSLARIRLMADQWGVNVWDQASLKMLRFFFDRAASLFTTSLEQLNLSAQQLDLIASSFEMDEEGGLRKLISSWSKSKESRKPINTWLLPEECHQSDWSQWACLRSQWASPVDQCLVTYNAELPHVEVTAGDVALFNGDWDLNLSVNGRALEWTDAWSCVCWFSDEEASFIELQQEQSGLRVLRQLTLLRDQNMFLIADSVTCDEQSQLDYCMTLPLAEGWNSENDSWTREVALQRDKLKVRVFPVSSPQTRVENGNGKIQFSTEEFQIEQSANATGLYVATLFDWSKKRTNKPVDWSRLTVAENMATIPPSVAAAQRIRIGKSQWMLYHSMKSPDFPRSFLGFHSGQETIFARVESDGEIVPIVEVDSPE